MPQGRAGALRHLGRPCRRYLQEVVELYLSIAGRAVGARDVSEHRSDYGADVGTHMSHTPIPHTFSSGQSGRFLF